MEEFERQEQIQRKEEHEEVHRKENGIEGGSGSRRKKEDKEEGSRSVRMIEDEGRSTRMTGDEGRSTQVSSPLRDASPPCTCAPDLPDGPTQSGSGRRREKDLGGGRKRGEGEEGRSRSKGRKEDKDKDWQELLEQSYLLPAPGDDDGQYW